MKNILYEALCEIYDLYEANGSSEEWFLEYMYSGIVIQPTTINNRIALSISDNGYHHLIFICTLDYLHYRNEDNEFTEEYKQTLSKIQKKYGHEYIVSFEKLKEDNQFETVKSLLKWVGKAMNYVFKELDKIDINTFGKKRKFESMLDDL